MKMVAQFASNAIAHAKPVAGQDQIVVQTAIQVYKIINWI
jgi:hypothetical protein